MTHHRGVASHTDHASAEFALSLKMSPQFNFSRGALKSSSEEALIMPFWGIAVPIGRERAGEPGDLQASAPLARRTVGWQLMLNTPQVEMLPHTLFISGKRGCGEALGLTWRLRLSIPHRAKRVIEHRIVRM